MTIVNPFLSIITLNVNGLNSPIKIHRKAELIKKQQTKSYVLSTMIHSTFKGTHWLKMKGWKTYYVQMVTKRTQEWA